MQGLGASLYSQWGLGAGEESAEQLPWSGVNSMACVQRDRELEPNLGQEGRVAKLCFVVPLESATIHSTSFLQHHPLHFN